MAWRRLAGPSSFAPSYSLPVGSMRNPLSLVRHTPTASKFSSDNADRVHQFVAPAQVGLVRCSSMRSRTESGFVTCHPHFLRAPEHSAAAEAAACPSRTSITYFPRRTGEVRIAIEVSVRMLPAPAVRSDSDPLAHTPEAVRPAMFGIP